MNYHQEFADCLHMISVVPEYAPFVHWYGSVEEPTDEQREQGIELVVRVPTAAGADAMPFREQGVWIISFRIGAIPSLMQRPDEVKVLALCAASDGSDVVDFFGREVSDWAQMVSEKLGGIVLDYSRYRGQNKMMNGTDRVLQGKVLYVPQFLAACDLLQLFHWNGQKSPNTTYPVACVMVAADGLKNPNIDLDDVTYLDWNARRLKYEEVCLRTSSSSRLTQLKKKKLSLTIPWAVFYLLDSTYNK